MENYKKLFTVAIFIALQSLTWLSLASESQSPTELNVGFKATPDQSISNFQPLLTDSTGNYSLGFLRVNKNQLSLSILHNPSLEPLWSANPTYLARWGDPTQFFFNGSLVLADSHTGVFWSTNTVGDRVRLSNSSNLIVESSDGSSNLWQSFEFPTDTLVERQNFTSEMTLTSSNEVYSMRLGPDNFGLFANFGNPSLGQIYVQHRAMQAKTRIIDGLPIHLVVQPDGYLGIFQNGSIPAEVASFNSFQQNVSGIRRVRLEPDGNLKAYYWTGSSWVLDYQEIPDPCELPSACGPYSVCRPGRNCSCLDESKDHKSSECDSSRTRLSGDFCGSYMNRYKVLRRTGVELPFKELMEYVRMDSLEKCEGACDRNCTCWGAVYSNSSGFCYMLDYPIQTLVAVGDETKVGYFKMRKGVRKQNVGAWLGLGLGLLFGAILVLAGVVGVAVYKLRKRRVKGYEEEGGVGPYKDLGSASFRSIELCEK